MPSAQAEQDGNVTNITPTSLGAKPTFHCNSLSFPCHWQLFFSILLFHLRIIVSFLFLIRVLIQSIH